MSTSVQASVARLHWRNLLALYGEDVTYVRGDLSIPLRAVPATPRAKQVSGEETIVFGSKQMHWLVHPDDLKDGDTPIEPKRGDKIQRPSGQRFVVSPADGGDDVWRWADGACTWRRVQTEER